MRGLRREHPAQEAVHQQDWPALAAPGTALPALRGHAALGAALPCSGCAGCPEGLRRGQAREFEPCGFQYCGSQYSGLVGLASQFTQGHTHVY